jgi:hypothetical protein
MPVDGSGMGFPKVTFFRSSSTGITMGISPLSANPLGELITTDPLMYANGKALRSLGVDALLGSKLKSGIVRCWKLVDVVIGTLHKINGYKLVGPMMMLNPALFTIAPARLSGI